MSYKTLTELANFYGSDKGSICPRKTKGAHNFTDIYEAYLSEFRNNSMNILEIGLGVNGESLKMWHDYFYNSMVYGGDIKKYDGLDSARIKTFVLDQGNKDDLVNFIKRMGDIRFDIIIDDGSHRPDHQQLTLSYLFPLLKERGFYFIEDLLPNGHGDTMRGDMSCDRVINTRRVLKNYKGCGKFLEPNALTNTEYIMKNIEYINFHAPRIDVKFISQLKLNLPIKKVVSYKQDSENLCLIRKRAIH